LTILNGDIDTPGMIEIVLKVLIWQKTLPILMNWRQNENLPIHSKEPNCAVQAAINSGLLSKARFESYLKYKKQ